MALGDLSGCATIAVQLDEAAAEAIYNGLVRRGTTTAPHWAEAFEKSDGLTLEFTHMLTSGRRLDECEIPPGAGRARQSGLRLWLNITAVLGHAFVPATAWPDMGAVSRRPTGMATERMGTRFVIASSSPVRCCRSLM